MPRTPNIQIKPVPCYDFYLTSNKQKLSVHDLDITQTSASRNLELSNEKSDERLAPRPWRLRQRNIANWIK
jgi:hypothetical protein